MADISQDLKDNYQARHDAGIPWAALADGVDDADVAAFLRGQKEDLKPVKGDDPVNASAPKKRTASA